VLRKQAIGFTPSAANEIIEGGNLVAIASKAKVRLTRVEVIAKELEEDIFLGRLNPQDKLDETELAKRFKTSRTPVREALHYLASTGLVEIRPRQAAIVASLTLKRLLELIEIMAHLEELATRLAAINMSDTELQQLEKIHNACVASASKGDSKGYYASSKIFHEILYTGSHNQALAEMARNLRNRIFPYLRNQLNIGDRLARSLDEHERVFQTLKARDAEAAGALMRAHVMVQGDVFSNFVSALPNAETMAAMT
jgi:DNA-binding GntR family transcriptional regulator